MRVPGAFTDCVAVSVMHGRIIHKPAGGVHGLLHGVYIFLSELSSLQHQAGGDFSNLTHFRGRNCNLHLWILKMQYESSTPRAHLHNVSHSIGCLTVWCSVTQVSHYWEVVILCWTKLDEKCTYYMQYGLKINKWV